MARNPAVEDPEGELPLGGIALVTGVILLAFIVYAIIMGLFWDPNGNRAWKQFPHIR